MTSNPNPASASSTWGEGLAQETSYEVLTYQCYEKTAVPAKERQAASTTTSLVNCRISMPAVHLDGWGAETLFKRKAETFQSAVEGIIPKLSHPLPEYANELCNRPAAREFRAIPVDSYEQLCQQFAASQRRRAAGRRGSEKVAAEATTKPDPVVKATLDLIENLSSAGLLLRSFPESKKGKAQEKLMTVYKTLMDKLKQCHQQTARQRNYLKSARDGLMIPAKCADHYASMSAQWIASRMGSPSAAATNPFVSCIDQCIQAIDNVLAKTHLLGVLLYKHGPLAHGVADELLGMRGPLHSAGHALESLLVKKCTMRDSDERPTRINEALRVAAGRIALERKELRGRGFKLPQLPFEMGKKPEMLKGAHAPGGDSDDGSSDDSDEDGSGAVVVAGGGAKRKRSMAQLKKEQSAISREIRKRQEPSSTPSKKKRKKAKKKGKKVSFTKTPAAES